jgi:hypothetical protein
MPYPTSDDAQPLIHPAPTHLTCRYKTSPNHARIALLFVIHAY